MSGHAPLIDFHAHILPGADHGSSGIEESLNQLALIQNAGVDTVVATPHFYPNLHNPTQFLQAVNSSAEKLAAHLSDSSPRICIGAEVLYCDRLDEMEQLDQLCIRGTNILLLELPMSDWHQELFDTVEALSRQYTVVLAHIDRYIRIQQEEIGALLALGAYAQINTSAFFCFLERKRLAPFLESDRVVALGSDLHNAPPRQYHQFVAAKRKLGAMHPEIMRRSQALLKNATDCKALYPA